ncbi:MAG TPA: ATP-binding protein, partial [Streptosporangiaceae bacterium]|nr:ATP-binding protein [Streptosporangiaceae bacterium]
MERSHDCLSHGAALAAAEDARRDAARAREHDRQQHAAELAAATAQLAAANDTITALRDQLMGTEAAAAEARKFGSRLRWAALPAPWTLADYDFSAQPGASSSPPLAADAA